MDKLPKNREPLYPAAFQSLPLGAVKPRGWLLNQLKVQANGLSGHLDEFWPDLGPNNGWLGGDGESWERGPYYLDGLLPLAHLLDDKRLLDKVEPWIEWTLNSQDERGYFGPRDPDWWPRMVMLKVLMMHYEVSEDERVLRLMSDYFRYQMRALPVRPLHMWSWARAMDNVLVAHWLYNFTGDAFLLELAQTLIDMTLDWPELQANYSLRNILPLGGMGQRNDDACPQQRDGGQSGRRLLRSDRQTLAPHGIAPRHREPDEIPRSTQWRLQRRRALERYLAS